MNTLRLTQATESRDRYRVEIALEGAGIPRQIATASFSFHLTPQDQEDLRWYLEDYLQNPFDPAPKIAARIEERLAEIGVNLFKAIFQANNDASDLWANLRRQIKDTRVEIITEVRESTQIPWELLRDPKTDTPLVLRALSFVRSHPNPTQPPKLPAPEAGPMRILLAICRPGGGDDVPFRSVASRLIKGLDPAAREALHLDVLRPPTFERLGQVLRAAYDRGEPYHILHFDGHGDYLDLEQLLPQWQDATFYPKTPRPGAHGYLAFENHQGKSNIRFVDGQDLGNLLVETGVPVLVLNACRSASADVSSEPDVAQTDPHTKVRAFGSFAQEVMDAGVAGVVGMRYSVYVVTAAQFVADLYASLAQGQTLGQAVTLGRKQLHDNPLRYVTYEPQPLQDWPVPVVFEATPLAFRPRMAKKKLKINLADGQATPAQGQLDPQLPKTPDAGFFGRDETLMALDRAFDSQTVMLLHSYAGSGKTATAAEFARWYALTGGVTGSVLFTAFNRYLPLSRVSDKIGEVFDNVLAKEGVNWLALAESDRRHVALQVLRQIPVLWIWDNVEEVTGFPVNTPSALSKAEQEELADFLREARDTRAKFLLTSRREEWDWLGDLPARFRLPPLQMHERVQLSRALAAKHGRRLNEIENWKPLLKFSQGNPLTIAVVVRQALRDGLRTKEQIEDFVGRLRAGEATFDDEASEGRDRSLTASLNYGFEQAFSEEERRQLALLHLFQGFLQVNVIRAMGDPIIGNLSELGDLPRERIKGLLDKAAEVGLIEPQGGGLFSIHPALPWFFQRQFIQSFSGEAAGRAVFAFIQAVSDMGIYYCNQYESGHREMIIMLATEEGNLLQARHLALDFARGRVPDPLKVRNWWEAVIGIMEGLGTLYTHTGRRMEWYSMLRDILVEEIINPNNDGPQPGQEENWANITKYRVLLAMDERRWTEAARLQDLIVEWCRQQATQVLAMPPNKWDSQAHYILKKLAISLETLGNIQQSMGQLNCIETYKESLSLSELIGDQAGSAVCAFNLGHTYRNVKELRNLTRAEHWYQRSLKLRPPQDLIGCGRCLIQLGHMAMERFHEAHTAQAPREALQGHLNDAAQRYSLALKLLPEFAVDELFLTHNSLGNLNRFLGMLNESVRHYRQAIGYLIQANDFYHAGQTCLDLAVTLVGANRLSDALDYARAARRNFETFIGSATEEIQGAENLIVWIEQTIKSDKAEK